MKKSIYRGFINRVTKDEHNREIYPYEIRPQRHRKEILGKTH